MQIAIPQVNQDSAVNFSKVWLYNGLAVTIDSTSIAFAVDFANIVLKSIFEQIAQQAQAQMQSQPTAQQGEQTQVIQNESGSKLIIAN